MWTPLTPNRPDPYEQFAGYPLTQWQLSQLEKSSQWRVQRIMSPVKKMLSLKESLGIRYIILFGSNARGTWGEHSDVDLMVLLKSTGERRSRMDIVAKLDEVVDDENVDIHVDTVDGFNDSTSVFCNEVWKDGVIVWKA